MESLGPASEYLWVKLPQPSVAGTYRAVVRGTYTGGPSVGTQQGDFEATWTCN